MGMKKSPDLALETYRNICKPAPGLSCASPRRSATMYRFPLALSRTKRAPVAQRHGEIVRLHTNTYHQAIVALVVMKQEEQAYVDVGRDDCAISTLMKLTHAATEKLIEAYLRGDYPYPSESVLLEILEMLENTGVFGAGQ